MCNSIVFMLNNGVFLGLEHPYSQRRGEGMSLDAQLNIDRAWEGGCVCVACFLLTVSGRGVLFLLHCVWHFCGVPRPSGCVHVWTRHAGSWVFFYWEVCSGIFPGGDKSAWVFMFEVLHVVSLVDAL
jgi:hypothetical protein